MQDDNADIQTQTVSSQSTDPISLAIKQLDLMVQIGDLKTTQTLDAEARVYTRTQVGWAASANAAGLVFCGTGLISDSAHIFGSTIIASGWMFLLGLSLAGLAAHKSELHLHLEADVFPEALPYLQVLKDDTTPLVASAREALILERFVEFDELNSEIKSKAITMKEILSVVDAKRKKAMGALLVARASLALSFMALAGALFNPLWVITFGAVFPFHTELAQILTLK